MTRPLQTLVTTIACMACVAMAAPGDLDSTFGDGGTRYVGDVPEAPMRAMIQLADGRLLALVNPNEGGGYLWRLNSDGTPDTTFAEGGVFNTAFLRRQPATLFGPSAIGVDAAGRTLLAIFETTVSGDYYLGVGRLLPDGTIDPAFGLNGKAQIRVADDVGSAPVGVVIQADGRIVLASSAANFSTHEEPIVLARFLANGAPDASFGNNGYLRLPINARLPVITQQPDGKLVVAGRDFGQSSGQAQSAGAPTVVARLLADGQLDSTFATAGIYRDSRDTAVEPLAVTLQADGKVLIAGSVGPYGMEQIGLLRLDSQGRIDASFGTGGRVVYQAEPSHRTSAATVALDSHDRIVVAGPITPVPVPPGPSYVPRILVARFLSDGRPDLQFDGAGSTAVWKGFGAAARAIAIRSSDSILIGGNIEGQPYYFVLGRYARTPRAALFALKGGDGAAERPIREARAVEYFHPGLGHYFLSATPFEIGLLDTNWPEWARTGRSFRVWSASAAQLSPTCRFWSDQSFAPKSSHFYTPYAHECDALKQGAVWRYERDEFYVRLPEGVAGAKTCPANAQPLYRAYNANMTGAPNHRYTTDPALLDQLIAQGWIMEGEAQTRVFACVPVP